MPAALSTGNGRIRIRMYRVGFGDCFLMTLPSPGGSRHVLVDCGVHARGNIGTIEKAVDDVGQETGGNLDIVIATHAHQDHLSGFGTYATKFSAFAVKEVWMPWTENPADQQAATLKKKQLALVGALTEHFAALNDQRNAAVQATLLNLASNQAAFDLLRTGFRGATVKYFEAGQQLQNAAGIDGLAVKVLGPPRDQSFLAKMDPPAGQRYLRLVGNKTEGVNALRPFSDRWRTTPRSPAPSLSGDERKTLKQMVSEPNEGLAFALDQAINNTSLVTLFQYRSQNLLFPGDAQYGNWKFWIDEDDAGQILSQIDFYKVAHHGSVNATPKDALEKMTTGHFAAMMSTQSTPWPSIPDKKLLDALDRKTAERVVQSDSLRLPGAPNGPALTALPKGFEKGAFWFDYSIPLG